MPDLVILCHVRPVAKAYYAAIEAIHGDLEVKTIPLPETSMPGFQFVADLLARQRPNTMVYLDDETGCFYWMFSPVTARRRDLSFGYFKQDFQGITHLYHATRQHKPYDIKTNLVWSEPVARVLAATQAG